MLRCWRKRTATGWCAPATMASRSRNAAVRSRAPLLHTSTLIWPAPRRATRRRYDESGDQRRHQLPPVDQGRERAWVEDRGK